MLEALNLKHFLFLIENVQLVVYVVETNITSLHPMDEDDNFEYRPVFIWQVGTLFGED